MRIKQNLGQQKTAVMSRFFMIVLFVIYYCVTATK